ncbi:hypothetical protein HK100_001773 [Physocladia obscura]|uniref:Uncharacterized protein n=1 Tax=Physocladia obscura TaxID=109957 RepID=A0AAD5SYD6_9FUNG|nr:hypothetical protein HK100_001773 [Physocladia obscura]
MLKSAKTPIKLVPDEVLLVLVDEHCDIADAVSLAQSCVAFRTLIGARIAGHVTSSYYPALNARGISQVENSQETNAADTQTTRSADSATTTTTTTTATVHRIFRAIRSQRHTFVKLFQTLLDRPFSVVSNNKSLLVAYCRNMARLREVYPPNNDMRNYMDENPIYILDRKLVEEGVANGQNESSIFASDHENIYNAIIAMELKFPEIITSTLFDTMPARAVLTQFAQTNASQWITLELAVFTIWFQSDFNKLLRHAHTVNEKYGDGEYPQQFILKKQNPKASGTIFVTIGDDFYIHVAGNGKILYDDYGCGSDHTIRECNLEFNEFLSFYCEAVTTLSDDDAIELMYTSPATITNQ